jgi:hypothetical protein
MKADMPSGKVSEQYIDKIKYQKKALTVDIIRQAIKDELPVTQEIFIKKEVDTLGARAKPLTEDVVTITEKARQATVGGRIVSKAERKGAQEQVRRITFKTLVVIKNLNLITLQMSYRYYNTSRTRTTCRRI